MAGRPRLYHSKAEKMQAYRKRLLDTRLVVDRASFEQLQVQLQQLMNAVEEAKKQRNPLALSLDTISQFDLLQSLTQHFEDR
jgi:hypothetical protein